MHKRRRHQSLLTHSWPIHITKHVFQCCLLQCEMLNFSLSYLPGLRAMPKLSLGLLEGCELIPLLVPKAGQV